MDDVVTLDDVADHLKLTAVTRSARRRQVRELIEAGDLAPINRRVGPRRWQVSRFELLRYLGHPEYQRTEQVAS